jgi:hypothetical protein
MMIAVALVALALVVLPPAYVRLAWLYNTPPTTLALFAAEVNPVRPPTGRPRPQTHQVGQRVKVECDYTVGLLPRVPTGLPYKVSVVIKLMDDLSKSKNTVFESHQKTYLLVAGKESWNERRGRFMCDLTPLSPGQYIVRYEVNITDLFGREALGACNTLGLQAN